MLSCIVTVSFGASRVTLCNNLRQENVMNIRIYLTLLIVLVGAACSISNVSSTQVAVHQPSLTPHPNATPTATPVASPSVSKATPTNPEKIIRI